MPATLLLADNNATLARVVTLSFENEDIRVVSVTDGREAVKMIDLDPPDIVLAEIGTAHVDGYGVATHVKSSPGLRHIPVLLLSGAFEPVDEVRARATGCDGILVKPFDPRNLVQRVKSLLGAKDEIAAAAEAAAKEQARAMAMPVVELPADTPTELPPVLDLAAIDFEAPADDAAPVAPTRLAAEESPVVDLQFDALDAALAELDAAPKTPPTAAAAAVPELPDLETLMSFEEPVTKPVHPEESVSFASPGDATELAPEFVAAPADLGDLTSMAADHAGDETSEAHSDSVNAPAEPTPAAEPEPTTRATLSLSGAFAAFLSEEAGPSAGQTPMLVVPPPSARPSREPVERAAALPPGQALEEIVRRVLTEMTGDAVRTIVRDTAERLVREEIERIKAHPE